MSEQYLWDRTGEPDPEIERLEILLGTLRMSERPLVLPVERRPFFAWHSAAAACAAAIVLLVFGALRLASRSDWHLTSASGQVSAGRGLARLTGLRVGDSVRTGFDSHATIRIGTIGEVVVGPESEVMVVESRNERRRMALRFGSIHAQIDAPPTVFVVDTPEARAIDLGCEYDLSIGRDGSGFLRVQSGWVMLEYRQAESLVPEGAEALIRKGGVISAPFFADASPEFRAAIEELTIAGDDDPERRARAIRRLLESARRRDAYTIINLFRRTAADERGPIFDRLDELVPAPDGISRERVVAGYRDHMEPWWVRVREVSAVSAIRKKGPLRLGVYEGLEPPPPRDR